LLGSFIYGTGSRSRFRSCIVGLIATLILIHIGIFLLVYRT
jgi:hypothetical protein